MFFSPKGGVFAPFRECYFGFCQIRNKHKVLVDLIKDDVYRRLGEIVPCVAFCWNNRINSTFFLGHSKISLYFCNAVWTKLCGRHVENEALCFGLVRRNLRNFEIEQERG